MHTSPEPRVPGGEPKVAAKRPSDDVLTNESASERRRKAIYWGLAVVAVAGGVGAWLALRPAENQGPRYETAKVDRGRLTARVTATGSLSALVTVQVGSQVSGRLKEIHADFNSLVKKGQLLATIDPQLFEAQVAESRANLSVAQANLARAQAKETEAVTREKRLINLAEGQLVSTADRDAAVAAAGTARAETLAAKAAVEQARAGLERAETNLGYTKIFAPVDGVVLSRAVDVGQTVAASLQAPTLFTIAGDLSKMQVEAAVSEADVGKVSVSQKASFTVDAYPGERFTGVVRQVRNAPTTVQNVVTYAVIIAVPNDDHRLKPGMTANVSFVTGERDDVVRIPNAALRYRPPRTEGGAGAKAAGAQGGGQGTGTSSAARGKWSRGGGGAAQGDEARKPVYVLRGAAPERVMIKTGLSDGTYTELVDGDVKEGDTLVTGAIESSKPRQTGLVPGGAPRGRGF